MKSMFKKKFFYSILLLISILIAFYFIITSNFFLTRIVVPALGKHIIKANYSIRHAKYNPFTSYLELNDVLVGDINNPFIKAKKAHCYINIFSILKKTIEFEFHDIYIEDVDVNFIKNSEKVWSLPWLYTTVPPENMVKFNIDFTNIVIKNMNINYMQDIEYGKTPLEAKMSNLTVISDRIKNGLLASIKYQGEISIKSSTTDIRNGGNFAGTTKVNLSEWCVPSHINIDSIISNIFTGKKYPEIADRQINFDFDIKRQGNNPSKNIINYFRIEDNINNKLSSKLKATGHLNFYPFNFNTDIHAKPIRTPALRIFTNILGDYDFGNKSIFSYIGTINTSAHGFKSKGKINLDNIIPEINGYKANFGAPLNFFLNYGVSVNSDKKSMILQQLKSSLYQKKQDLVNISSTKPISLHYGTGNTPFNGEAPAINIDTSNLDLKIFNKIISKKFKIISGTLDSNITLSIAQNCSSLLIKGLTKTNNLIIEELKNKNITGFDIDQKVDIEIQKLNDIEINNYELNFYQKSEKTSKIVINGNYNFTTKKGKFHTSIPYMDQKLIHSYQNLRDKKDKFTLFLENLSPFYIFLENVISLDFTKSNLFNVQSLKIIFTKPEKGSRVTLTLLDDFSFNIKNKHIFLNKDVVLKSDVKNLDFANIIYFLPSSFPLKFNKGNFTYDLLLIVPKELNSIKVQGQIALLYSSLSFYKQYIRDLSITTKVNAELTDTKALNLVNSYSELYINGIQCLKAKTDGFLSFSKNEESNISISIQDINKYFLNIFYDGISANVVNLKAGGKINCKFSKSGENSHVTGKINMPEAILGNNTDLKNHQTVNGNLDFTFIGTEDKFSINNLKILLKKQKKEIVQIGVSGNFPIPLASKKSKLSITSDNIVLEELTPLYKHLTRTVNSTFVTQSGEYDPINFKSLTLDGDINFKSVTYGNILDSNFHSSLNINKSKVVLKQIKSQLNGTDIKYHGELETNHPNGYPFLFTTEFNDLNMKPFIETFIPGDYKDVKGTVDSFILSLQGKGFSKENIEKNLLGNLAIHLSDLSLPYQINQYNLVKVLLAPIVILEQIRERLPGGFLVKNFEEGIQATKNIIKNINNINISSGDIILTSSKGIVKLDKVEFLGEKK